MFGARPRAELQAGMEEGWGEVPAGVLSSGLRAQGTVSTAHQGLVMRQGLEGGQPTAPSPSLPHGQSCSCSELPLPSCAGVRKPPVISPWVCGMVAGWGTPPTPELSVATTPEAHQACPKDQAVMRGQSLCVFLSYGPHGQGCLWLAFLPCEPLGCAGWASLGVPLEFPPDMLRPSHAQRAWAPHI